MIRMVTLLQVAAVTRTSQKSHSLVITSSCNTYVPIERRTAQASDLVQGSAKPTNKSLFNCRMSRVDLNMAAEFELSFHDKDCFDSVPETCPRATTSLMPRYF
jgi:hypothetical protein